MIAIGLGAGAGCAGSRRDRCAEPMVVAPAANPDSLGVAEFLALRPAERRTRRQRSRREVADAHQAARVDIRLRKLTLAAGWAPDDPGPWLELARLWRALGDDLQTDSCLVNAALAIRAWDRNPDLAATRATGYKDAAVLETALLRAWLHYDRAEWRDAMPWVRAALSREPGNEAALQIRGLLEGIQGHQGMAREIAGDLRRKNAFTPDIGWIMGNLDAARGNYRASFSAFMGVHPDQRAVSECYRDMGRSAERVQEWDYARRWYRESAAAVPFRNISCLTEHAHSRISDRQDGPSLPFWLALDRFYVTGSLSAYLAFAKERFDAAASAAERDLWGGLVVNAAGICLRLEMEKVSAHRIRGLVFAQTDRPDRALADLQDVVRLSGEDDPAVARLEAEIGHLFLVQARYGEAAPLLRRALAGGGNSARVWSDLGLALIMNGDRLGAEDALTRALTLDRNLTAAWYNRGLMYLHAGDLDRAAADLERAAQLAPDNMDVAKLLQQVRRQRRPSQGP